MLYFLSLVILFTMSFTFLTCCDLFLDGVVSNRQIWSNLLIVLEAFIVCTIKLTLVTSMALIVGIALVILISMRFIIRNPYCMLLTTKKLKKVIKLAQEEIKE